MLRVLGLGYHFCDLLWPFSDLFLTFWSFGGQVGCGSEKPWKRDPGNQKESLPFHKKSVFFSRWFLMILLKFVSTAFFRLGQPKCPKWDTSGTTFPAIVQESWNGENYGVVDTKHYFPRFLGTGFGNDGQLFSSWFPNWVRACHFTFFFVKCRLQPGPQNDSVGHHFHWKWWVDFSLFSEGPGETSNLVKWLPGGLLWSYLAKAK
jgi:hypothetical protein